MAESEAQKDLDLRIAVLRHARKMKSDWQRLANILREESTQVLSNSTRANRPYPALFCPALPYPAIPGPILSCHTLSSLPSSLHRVKYRFRYTI